VTCPDGHDWQGKQVLLLQLCASLFSLAHGLQLPALRGQAQG
jgi:hypothetical protein